MNPPAIVRGLLAACLLMLTACGPAPKVVRPLRCFQNRAEIASGNFERSAPYRAVF